MADTTQRISTETLDRIKEIGRMGDSFESVIQRLIDEHYELQALRMKKERLTTGSASIPAMASPSAPKAPKVKKHDNRT
jgi:hypothetical protein